jgi:serine protease SohB
MEHVYDYLVFLAQAVTIVVMLLVVLAAIAGFSARRGSAPRGHLEVENVNDRFDDLRQNLLEAVLPAQVYRKEAKRLRNRRKKEEKSSSSEPRRRVFVLDFDGDLAASRVSHLRREVDAVLTQATASDEVVVRLESPGGLVHAYGLAASQLHRVRAKGIPLVAAVDKIAASGGYLMAAVADRVIAAPFAVVGSIGVVAQIPNVYRLLKKNVGDVGVLTAGQYRRTRTVCGENTEEARRKFVEELEDTHQLFQEFVAEHRPGVDMDRVATGETWYGQRAVAMNLVDEVATSDQYLMERAADADVYEVRWVEQKKPIERLLAFTEDLGARITGLFPSRG